MITKPNVIAMIVIVLMTVNVPEVTEAAVGKTEGSAGVTVSGDATYTVPVKLPPGVNGLTPEIAITYNHQQGESIAGVGWGISGLSTITRCAKTKAQDGTTDGVNLEVSDRYCLDGNQLRHVNGSYGVSGSTYRTEVDTVSRITANGTAGSGPAWFKVESKDGLIYQYGSTTSSRIESLALGKTTTARVWALDKIKDRSGNEINITYLESGAPFGTYRPLYITYRTNPAVFGDYYIVTFTYENQPAADVDTSYATAGIVEDALRLKSIDIGEGQLSSAQPVRKYNLAYESSLSSTSRSRLATITECAPVTDCLAPITFAYQNGTSGLTAETSSGSTISGFELPLAIDINGDGRTDLVFPSGSTGTWMYRLANTSGGYNAAQNSGIANTNWQYAIAIEFNGDGLDDILVPYSGGTWWVIKGTATGLATPVNTNAPHLNDWDNAAAFDMNGDGREDLVWGEDVGTNQDNGKIKVRYREGAGFSSTASTLYSTSTDYYLAGDGESLFHYRFTHSRTHNFDVNGDGHKDLPFILWHFFQEEEEEEESFETYALLGGGKGTWYVHGSDVVGVPIDLNGDGYSDIAMNSGSILYSRVSNGKSFGTTRNIGTYTGMLWHHAVVVDWSGDGFEDLLVPKNNDGYWYLFESDGFALKAPTNTYLTHSSVRYAYATDSNGDGMDDVAYVKSNGAFVHRAHAGLKPDLLVDVTDGYGNTVEFHYAALTDSAVYSKGSGAVLPVYDYLEPRYVVKALEQSTGVGTTYNIGYHYEGAKVNIEGRGIGGFEKRTGTDSRTGMKVIESFHTDFPYRGRTKKREVRLSDNTLVHEISSTWSKATGGSGFQNYHYPYVSTSTEKNFEAGGAANGKQVNTIVKTSTVDAYGTPYDTTTVTTEHADANGAMSGATFTQRTYTPTGQLHNVTSTWCIGRRQQVQKISSHSATYGASITRTTDYLWDTGNSCRVTRQTIEPNSTNYKVVMDLEYDTFGNIDRQTVTGKDGTTTMPTRVTQINWGTLGQFPHSVTNPLSQVSTLTWDLNTGDLLSVTDPNGLSTSWLYDAFNRRIRETAPAGTYVDYSYTACTSANSYCGAGYSTVKTRVRASTKNTSGAEVRFDDEYLDALGRSVETANQIIGGGTTKTRTIYDASGRVWKRSSPTLTTSTLYFTETSFDALGRPIQVSRRVDDSSATEQHSYIYYEGLRIREKDANAHETSRIHDALGRVYQSHDELSHYQQFDYDAFGSVIKVTDCVSSTCTGLTTSSYQYGSEAFKTESIDMSLGDWDYSYNSLGELTAYNDAKTSGTLPTTATATFTWDKLGRPLTRTEAEGTTTWTWGTSSASKNIGSLASVSSPGHSQSYTYDAYGRLNLHRRIGGGTYDTTYVYSATTGLLESVQYPASTGGYRFKVLHEYDRGMLKRVKRSDLGQTVYWEAQTQNAFGNVIDEDFGNGSTTVRGYDGVTGRIDYIQTDKSATSLQDLTYTWDAVGNLETRKDWRQSGNPTESFSYDALDRLTDADITGAATSNLNVVLNANGNIQSKDDVSGSTWVYHNTNKHAVVTAGANSYSYDANGNMTSRKGDTITWTSYNYPSEINDGPRTFHYSYDASREKWKQVVIGGSVSETTYFAGRIFEKNVHGSDTEHRHYITANGRAVALFVERSAGSDYTRYFTHDHLGSTDGIIQDDGTTIYVDESFSAFGERRDPTDWVGDASPSDLTKIAATTDRGYTDHFGLEQSALVHMGGRVYDAEIGRFLSPDPMIANPRSTQGFNRYAYVQGNSMRYTDPSGFFCTDPYSVEVCVSVIGSVVSFIGGLFGDDDEPPPPNHCKDNTSGCGGSSASKLTERTKIDNYTKPLEGELPEGVDEIVVIGRKLSRINWAILLGVATPSILSTVPSVAAPSVSSVKVSDPQCVQKIEPVSPPGVDIDANILLAENSNTLNPFWFHDRVKNRGIWDFKQLGRKFEAFGNFHYGATGYAFGFREDILLNGAGRAQVAAGTSRPAWGKPGPWLFPGLGKPPYGDDPRDQFWIKQGFDYYKNPGNWKCNP